MIERKIAEQFLHKNVVINYEDDNQDRITKGIITEVTENSILLDYRDSNQAISLKIINFIREVPNND